MTDIFGALFETNEIRLHESSASALTENVSSRLTMVSIPSDFENKRTLHTIRM